MTDGHIARLLEIRRRREDDGEVVPLVTFDTAGFDELGAVL